MVLVLDIFLKILFVLVIFKLGYSSDRLKGVVNKEEKKKDKIAFWFPIIGLGLTLTTFVIQGLAISQFFTGTVQQKFFITFFFLNFYIIFGALFVLDQKDKFTSVGSILIQVYILENIKNYIFMEQIDIVLGIIIWLIAFFISFCNSFRFIAKDDKTEVEKSEKIYSIVVTLYLLIFAISPIIYLNYIAPLNLLI